MDLDPLLGLSQFEQKKMVRDSTLKSSTVEPHRIASLSLFLCINNLECPLIVPGPVSSLRSTLTLNSVVLSWSVPQEPNGLVIDYKITYSVNDSSTITNTTPATTFSITSLMPQTRVHNVSVVARTGAGLGETATLPDLVTPRKPCTYVSQLA